MYYAVKQGKIPGIYNTWSECRQQVFGFANAVYKKFESEEEAKIFIETGEEETTIDIEEIIKESQSYAFVDGSFNSKTNIYGYGGFLIHKVLDEDGSITNEKYILQGSGDDEEMASMRNISGEILGSKAAIEKAIEQGLDKLTIFYDYMGIEMWASGLWTRNKKGTKEYYDYCQSVKDDIKLRFIKVKGHTGVPGNEEADRLAKISVGIIENKEDDKEGDVT